jgi:hypothetical protein
VSNEERVRVLQMVAEGKVSPAEADEVLGALTPPPSALKAPTTPPGESKNMKWERERPVPRRMLRIEITDENEGDRHIQVRIPAGLTPGQQEFLTRQVRRPLEEQGVDVSELLADLEQWPSGTTLFNLSQHEVHIDIRVE